MRPYCRLSLFAFLDQRLMGEGECAANGYECRGAWNRLGRVPIFVLAGVLLIAGTGCWGDRSEKAVKAACDALPTWHAESFKVCMAMSEPAKTVCLAKLNADYAEVIKKKVDFATAEEECVETAFKAAGKALSEAFKAIIPLLDANTQKTLKEADKALLNAAVDSTDGSHYTVSPGSMAMVFFEEGMVQQAQLAGFLDLNLHPEGDGWGGTVLAAQLTALTDFGPATATLNPAAPSTVTLQPDPDDPGTLIGGMHLLVDVDNDWLGDPLWWVNLPVVSVAPMTQLLITTEGRGVPGTEIMPTVASTADPEADCNGNGFPDGVEIADGLAGDCNFNGMPDDCDIANDYATDCNGNGIPDACELALGTQFDCNINGVLDECELASGTASDCNGNGIPDVCELSEVVVEEFFNPGSEPFGWWFLGDAEHDSQVGVARLVHSDVEFVAGVAALNDTGYVTDAFEVEFDFRMTNTAGGVPDGSGFPDPDGLAFIVSGNPLTLGFNGYGLGYKGLPLASFAVEFDTFENFVSGQPNDPDSNHVGIDVGGSVESIATESVVPDFDKSGPWHVRVRWMADELTVYLTPPGGQEMEAIAEMIPPQNIPPVKYFGFGAGTGINSADTDVDNVVITLLDADLNGDGTLDECETSECPGDANGDGTVDPLDVGYTLARLGCPVGTGDPLCDAADQNEDGEADPLDVGFVLARFGDCPDLMQSACSGECVPKEPIEYDDEVGTMDADLHVWDIMCKAGGHKNAGELIKAICDKHDACGKQIKVFVDGHGCAGTMAVGSGAGAGTDPKDGSATCLTANNAEWFHDQIKDKVTTIVFFGCSVGASQDFLDAMGDDDLEVKGYDQVVCTNGDLTSHTPSKGAQLKCSEE